MGCRAGLALAAALMLLCCAAAQPTIDQADEGALEPNGRKVLGVIGPFQQKVLAAGAVGWATGGPSGAAMNMGGTVLGNHAKKRWGFGRKMLNADFTADRAVIPGFGTSALGPRQDKWRWPKPGRPTQGPLKDWRPWPTTGNCPFC